MRNVPRPSDDWLMLKADEWREIAVNLAPGVRRDPAHERNLYTLFTRSVVPEARA